MKFRLTHRNFILEPESFPHDGNPALANNFKSYERAFFRIGGPQHLGARIGEQLELRKAGLRRYIFLARLHNAPGGRYGPGLDRSYGGIVVFKSSSGEISIGGPPVKHSQRFSLGQHKLSGYVYGEIVPLVHNDGGAAITEMVQVNAVRRSQPLGRRIRPLPPCGGGGRYPGRRGVAYCYPRWSIPRTTRRTTNPILSAAWLREILAADIVGFSRLTDADEDRTLASQPRY